MGALAIDSDPSLPTAPQGAAIKHGTDFDEFMTSLRRLTTAASVHLIAFDRRSLAVKVAAACDWAQPLGPADERLLVAALSHDAPMLFATPRATWLQSPDRNSPWLLLPTLTHRGTTAFSLLVNVVEPTQAARDRVEALIRDIARVITAQLDLETQLLEARSRHQAAAAALDHNECAVMALDADHSIVLANAAATAMLAEENGLQVRRGVVRPTDYHDSIRFQTALDSVIAPTGRDRMATNRALLMLLSREHGDRPLVVVIVPVTGDGATGPSPGTAAILYVLRPEQHGIRGLESLCRLHGLSPVETRLVAHLYAGLTVTEAAAKMHVKTDTARAYLKQVFAKTDTHRQADLVALLSRYLRAVRGNFDFQAA